MPTTVCVSAHVSPRRLSFSSRTENERVAPSSFEFKVVSRIGARGTTFTIHDDERLL